MNKLTLQGVQDFALTTDALAFMQSAFESFEQLGFMGGDNIIVSGCVVTGSSVSSGWMFLKGKLMPFSGGSIQTNVRIVEVVQNITVDIASREQRTYHAEFGTSADPDKNTLWADIKRFTKLIDVYSKVEVNNLFNVTDLTITDFTGFHKIQNNGSSIIQFFKMGKVVVVTGALWFAPAIGSDFYEIPATIGNPKKLTHFTLTASSTPYNVLCYALSSGVLTIATAFELGVRHQFNFSYMIE